MSRIVLMIRVTYNLSGLNLVYVYRGVTPRSTESAQGCAKKAIRFAKKVATFLNIQFLWGAI